MKPAQLLADVRALGSGAPVRVAYEASKRTGFHALLFRGIPKTPVPRFRSPFRPPPDLPAAARKRALHAADKVVGGKIEIFGDTIAVGSPPDWHRVLHEQGTWPLLPWWKIDIRSADRLGDVKWVWELGRHRHLVLLARAAYVEPAGKQYLEILETHLRSWLDQNPPEMGVHWYSNLEIALRGIAWLQILSLVGDQLEQPTVMRMQETLYLTGRHLVVDLPYTVSTMRNNHLIGDGLGLVALGLAFPDDKAARRWARIGDRLIDRQLRRHFKSDGSSIEDSVSYSRFVLEMLSIRKTLGQAPNSVSKSLLSGAGYLARLGVLEGAVPQFGDWDEGRGLAVSEHPEDLAGSVRLAFALSGTGAPAEWSDLHDEVAWYSSRGTPVEPPVPVTDGNDAGGGIGRAQSGDWTVWLKAGSERSHGHADLLSTPIRYRGSWVVGDPGTGTYNGPVEQRNYFRSSLAHNVARIDSIDQLEPHRAFRWRHSANGALGEALPLNGSIIMWGVHDAYMRLDPPCRVARVVVVQETGVVVGDWVEDENAELLVSLPLPPSTKWENGPLRLPDGRGLELTFNGNARSTFESTDPFDGWWSDTYGSMSAAQRIELMSGTSRTYWAVTTGGVEASFDHGVLHVDRICIRVTFEEEGVQLAVETPSGAHRRSL